MGSTGPATLALAAGVAGSIQIATLGMLGQRIGELEAAAFAFALTAVAGVVILLVTRRSLAGIPDALGAPAWMWLGGLAGVFVVTSIIVTGPRIGIVATSALLIAGQLAAATLIDRFGWLGVERVGIGWPRAVGLVLLAAGALLTLRR
jgi:bacterial/archaeal transporter family-2 protein